MTTNRTTVAVAAALAVLVLISAYFVGRADGRLAGRNGIAAAIQDLDVGGPFRPRPRPPLPPEPVEPPHSDPSEAKLWASLKDRVDARAERKVVALLQEAEDEHDGVKTGVGSAILGILTSLVGKLVKYALGVLLVGMIGAVLVGLFWAHWHWAAAALLLHTAWTWLVARLTSKKS